VRDTPIDRVIRKSLSAGVRKTAADPCDENLMAAYLDSSLSAPEMTAFESHVATCEVCQEILAVAVKLQVNEESGPIPVKTSSAKKTLFRFSIPIPVIGALLIFIAIVAVVFRMQTKTDQSAIREERVADLRAAMQRTMPQADEAKLDKPGKDTLPDASLPTRLTTAGASKRGRIEDVPEGSEEKDQAGADTIPSIRSDLAAVPASPPAIVAQATPPPPPPAEAMKMSALSEKDQAVSEKKKAEGEPVLPTDTIASAEKPEPSKTGSHGGFRRELSAASQTAAQSAPALPTGTASVTKQKGNDEAEGPVAAETTNAIAPARTQEPFPRPPIYASTNRIATTLYSTESTESSLRFVIKNLGSNLKAAESKKIGDRVFYKHMGYWIDRICTEHPENQIVEIISGDVAGDKDYTAITKKYADIRSILPAVIYWENKSYLLRH